MKFSIIFKDKHSRARIGVMQVPSGMVSTPAFVPVATQAVIKGLSSEQMKELGTQIMIANTYHLMLRPGADLVKKMGGLHKFMNWQGALMTDSGGFQVFSLGSAFGQSVSKVAKKNNFLSDVKIKSDIKPLAKISEQGVEFCSHIDGAKHFLTPELSIEIQNKLGADIIFALDECTSPMAGKKRSAEALGRTTRWAIRSLEAHQNKKQTLFGIVQGGIYNDLRARSAKEILKLGFEGFGIGGSFGENQMAKITRLVNDILPQAKPKHLLGIGEVGDIILAVEQGIDLFDCVTPTRYGRHGLAMTSLGRLNINLAKFSRDKSPIDKNCGCGVCRNYSRAYIRHLFSVGELNGPIFLTQHNIFYIMNLFKEIRESIKAEKFLNFKNKILKQWKR